MNFENYSQLLDAFKETHGEANRLALLNNRMKGMNNWLENRVKALEEELNNLKNDFANLELIYKNAFCKCDSSFFENCESLQMKVHYLVKTMDKLSKGQSNFETILASQHYVFGKAGLGFNPHSNKRSVSKPFSIFFEKQLIEKSKQLVVSCFYYMKKGHSVRFCRVRKFFVHRDVLKWVPTNSKVPNDQNILVNAQGPKFVRGPNLAS